MKKKELNDMRVLEKIFEAEIDGRLPKQFRANNSIRLDRMAAGGLIEKVNAVLPGHPPVSVAGWVLTHYGRRTYCQYAATLPATSGAERKDER